ncbi:molybdopterin-dependent oxidoreductase [Tsukamurella paurometabola]|uniref:Molybdopterin-dependent oxidoreductase n=1 Tax=Tsukamurella paurometabola TaxID=2061 RepID=A0ABS5ND32_TSUPA|nr:molybdopterin-dependent oxidoreductase [Tsukamurella paurometabola]MBS4102165.1 molybdopterin-dependent oxidoreductase [Tsukamurella paurometabola]
MSAPETAPETPAHVPLLRRPGIAARLGVLLGVCVVICFATGIFSHWIQHPPSWFVTPRSPAWLYQLTQGVHVASGVAAIPLVLLKLAAVYPKLFERPMIGSPVRLLERAATAVLVASMLFQLFTGLLNISQWYAWTFFFTTTHYATAYLVLGAVAVHLAIKLPLVVAEFRRRTAESVTPGLPRRAVLTAGIAAAGLAVVTVGSQSVPALHRLGVFAPRSGSGPQGMPVNRTAAAAGVATSAHSGDYRLVLAGPTPVELTLEQLRAMPQHTARLPLACVEGWTQYGWWSGVRVGDLAALAGLEGRNLRFVSLERGPYGQSEMDHAQVTDADTLLALRLGGEDLDLDHGFPCRLIAASRPGVQQTKWISRIEAVR